MQADCCHQNLKVCSFFCAAAVTLKVAYAEYELDAIMLTGSCSEHAPGKQLPPPKGLELHLGTQQQPHQVGVVPHCYWLLVAMASYLTGGGPAALPGSNTASPQHCF